MRLIAAVVACAALATACGWTPADEQVLTRFFEQSRIYDRTRLAEVAQVAFNPRIEGVVERFRIVERSDEPMTQNRVRRRLKVEADVRSTGGRVSQRTLVITLQRHDAGWIVVAFE